jgi:hypothetical protein
MKNNYLLFFYKDGSKDCFSLPSNSTEKRAFDHVLPLIKSKKYNIKKYLFIEGGDLGLDIYQRYYNLNQDNEFKFDERQFLIDKKVEEIRFKRDILLSNLDIPFMRSVEDDDSDRKEYITKLKNFLRDLPSNLKMDEIKTAEEVLRYNPFNNIFSVKVADGGEGYDHNVEIEIEPPNGKFYGFEAKGIAIVKDGKIQKVEIIDPGCGYSKPPKITPKDRSGAVSIRQASLISGPLQNSF